MTTAVLQMVAAVLTIACGATAIAVARRDPGPAPIGSLLWFVAGLTWVLIGGSGIVHALFAIWAIVSGPGSEVWDLFLRWSPVGNHGRGFVTISLTLALAVIAAWPTLRVRPRMLVAVGLGAMAVGSWWGWREGPLVPAAHFTAIVLAQVVALVLMMTALLISLVRRVMDTALWIALLVFVLHQVTGILWSSMIIQVDLGGAWKPQAWQQHAMATLQWTIILAICVWRLSKARRGVSVSAGFSPPDERQTIRIG